MSEIADALGKGFTREFAGRSWKIDPLDFNDLADLEVWLEGENPAGVWKPVIVNGVEQQVHLSGIETLDLGKVRHQRQILYLVMRKADPQLGDDDRRHCRYHMTAEDVGRMLSGDVFENGSASRFISEVLQLSGVLPKPGSGAEDRQSKKAVRPSLSAGKSGASRPSSDFASDTTPDK